MNGTLYIVATPIGNLEDITLRALRVLKEVDLIACEDTRRTKILLDHFQIFKPTVSYHQRSKIQKVDFLVSELLSGKKIAQVSDAGTPGISDPGGVLVEQALKNGIEVVPLPGPSALTALASVAGIPMDKFLFLGFLPHKKGRETLFRRIRESDVPVIFYESPHRILKTLEAFRESGGQLILGRELTKKFEDIFRGSFEEAIAKFESAQPLGEFVVIYQPGKR
ncbi:MAG: 16S rRNA (cytidine(1402)-2'-O)-methyltransferase [Patescibacteria group bacterium]